MNWIRVDVALPTHRKMFDLEQVVGETVGLGYMVKLWCWAKSSAAHGRITGKNPVGAVESAVGWKGAAGAFVEAAIAVGFLHRKGDDLLVHDWFEHNGKALKQAKESAERARRWRSDGKQGDEILQGSRELPEAEAEGAEPRTTPARDPNAYVGIARTRTKSAPNPARTNEQTNEQTNERTTTTAPTLPPFALEGEASSTAKPRKLSPAQKLREDLRAMRAAAFPGVVDDVEIKPAALTATFDRLEKEATAKRATVIAAYTAYLQDDFARSRNPPCPLTLFVDANKFRESLSATLRSRGAGPALTLVSNRGAGGYASLAEIEAQDFRVDPVGDDAPEAS